MSKAEFYEIHGFASLSEYERFVQYINNLINEGVVSELKPCHDHIEYGYQDEKWFKVHGTDHIWRLVEPDPPFAGVWEKVKKHSSTKLTTLE